MVELMEITTQEKIQVGVIQDLTFTQLENIERSEKKFGMVIMGAGGELSEWVNGISDHLKEEGIVDKTIPAFSEAYRLSGNVAGKHGRTDLVVIFSDKSNPKIGKLSMWRLRMGDISWIDDFISNHRKDYR